MPIESLSIPDGCDGDLRLVRPSRMGAPHRHRELELNLVLQGEAKYILGGRSYQLGPRSVAWFFPAQEHLLASVSPDFRFWVGVFLPGLVERVAVGPSRAALREQDPGGTFCRRIGRAEAAELSRLCTGVSASRDDPPRFNAGLAHALLEAWEASAREGSVSLPHEAVHPGVETAARLLGEEEGDCGLSELARRAHLSPSRLSRLFRRQTGASLCEYRNRLRVERFLDLYGLGQRMTMLAAAYEAGFGSYAQFYRAFRGVMGMTPRQYRKTL